MNRIVLFLLILVVIQFRCSPPPEVDFSGNDSIRITFDELKVAFASTKVIPVQQTAEKEFQAINNLLESGLDPASKEKIVLTLEVAKYQGKLNNLLERLLIKDQKGVTALEKIRLAWSDNNEQYMKSGGLIKVVFSNSGISMLTKENTLGVLKVLNYGVTNNMALARTMARCIMKRKVDISPGFREVARTSLRDATGSSSDKSSLGPAKSYLK